MDMDMKPVTDKKQIMKRSRQAGNAIVMLFAAIGMAGVVTYGLNNVMRGPAATTSEVSRRTIAENNLVVTTRLAIASAATQQANGGDCDNDGFVEPIPNRNPGAIPAPTGGGLLPMTLGASTTDPWGGQYGYCVWDPGTVRTTDNDPACGGNTARRLNGSFRDDQPAIAVISPGKNGAFETTCAAFVDANGDNMPDSPMVVKAGGSDDIVLTYTYAEANGIGGGMWKLKPGDLNTAEIDKDIDVKGGATFTDGKMEMGDEGLILPGDPGDGSVTGACTEAKKDQLRRNTSSSPPTLEICDYDNDTSGDWTQVSGGSAGPGKFNPNNGNCTATNQGPFKIAASKDISSTGATDIYSVWTRSGTKNQKVFIGSTGGGLLAYNFNGSDFVLSDNIDPSISMERLWGDDTYIFAAGYAGGNGSVRAYGFDNIDLSNIANRNYPGTSVRFTTVTASSQLGVVVGTDSGNNIDTLIFNGSSLTFSATNPVGNSFKYNMFSVGDKVYFTGMPSELAAGVFNGAQLGSIVSQLPVYANRALASDGTYIYTYESGLHAYSFDGTTFTEVGTAGSYTSPAFNEVGLWSDGNYIFMADMDASRVLAFSFDGTVFTEIGRIDLPQITGSGQQKIWGDGNYIYVAGNDGSSNKGVIYALAGFECNNPNPSGGYVVASLGSDVDNLDDYVDRSLIAHWKLDEKTGTLAEDDVDDAGDGANDATFTNTPVWIDGVVGSGALSFEASERDALMIPGLLDEPSSLSMAVWFNASETDTGGSTIVSIGDYADIVLNPGPVIKAGYYEGSGWTVVNPTAITPGWHHAVYTFNETGNVLRLYIDGTLRSEATGSTGISYSGLGSDVYIGREGNGATDFDFQGAIDDVRIYDTALGPAEVKHLYDRLKQSSTARTVVPSYSNVPGNKDGISLGNDHACAVSGEGGLYCWGRDQGEQLGNGTAAAQSYPGYVSTPSDNVLYLTGINNVSPPQPGGNYFSKEFGIYPVAGSLSNTFTAGQTLTGYGFSNAYAQQDDGLNERFYSATINHTTNACVTVTVYLARVNGSGTVQTEVQLGAPAVFTGSSHTYSGYSNIGTWVAGDYVRLRYAMVNNCAAGTTMDITGATLTIPRIYFPAWATVGVGDTHSCGIRNDGSMWCWGDDTNGKLGNDTALTGTQNVPSLVANPPISFRYMPWTQVSAGANSTCGIKTDGTLLCWGNDTSGQLGNGGGVTADQPAPYAVGGTTWFSVSVGGSTACGLYKNGEARCWGLGTSGQIGDGNTSSVNTPTLVSAVGGQIPWSRISVGKGGNHVCGVKTDGTGWCWGNNSSGRLGIGSTSSGNFSSPQRITALDNWIEISAGVNHTCGLRADSSVWCWGSEANGRLGNGNTGGGSQNAPVPVPLGFGAVAIAAGDQQSCAMKSDGSVWCWGGDNYGQLGNGVVLTADQTSPSATLNFPGGMGWGWDDAQSVIMAPYNFNVGLGTGFLTESDSQRGFGFTSAGRAVIQPAMATQLTIETGNANSSSQISFKNSIGSSTANEYAGFMTRKWALDDSSGTTPTCTPSACGTLTGGPVWVPAGGKVGGALSFDGVDDRIVIPRDPNLEPTSFTLSFWMRRDAGNTAKWIIAKDYQNGTSASWAVGFDPGRESLMFNTVLGGVNQTLYGNVVIPENTWTHVTAVLHPVGTPMRMQLFVNGWLDTEINPGSGAITYDTNATNGRAYIGMRCNTPGSCGPFKGMIDNVRLYNNVAATPQQAAEIAVYDTQTQTPRSLGIDYANDYLELGRNVTGVTNMMNAITPDLNISPTGNVGIGVATPVTKLDINGSIRIGYESRCGASMGGAVRYVSGASPPYQYCNATAWTNFSEPTPPWRRTNGSLTGSWTENCAIKANGKAYCWGRNNATGLDNLGGGVADGDYGTPVINTTPSGWLSINTSGYHTCGVRVGGTGWCWGDKSTGALGDGTTTGSKYVQVTGSWKIIRAGTSFSCGVRTDGTAWCWGTNGNKQLGDGTTTQRDSPVQVKTDAGAAGWSDWKDIWPGSSFTCGIRVDGTAWCWGTNTNNRLGCDACGASPNYPVRVGAAGSGNLFSDWASLGVGGNHACGIRANGTLWCWGNTANGMTMMGATPTQIHDSSGSAYWSDWKKISVGWSLSPPALCGIRANGQMWCFGDPDPWMGGGNGLPAAYPPFQATNDVGSGSWSDWVDISDHIDVGYCGTRANGDLWCIGSHVYGQLGFGTPGSYYDYFRQVAEP